MTFERHVNAGRLVVFTADIAKLGAAPCRALLRTYLALITSVRFPAISGEGLKLPVYLFLDNAERLFGPAKAEFDFLLKVVGDNGISVIRT